jgi:hypothetical protein
MLSSSRLSRSSLTRFCQIAVPGVVLFCSVLSAQAPPGTTEQGRMRQINSTEGKDLYRAYCAQCHGEAGKGDGVRAATLTPSAPDLTTIAVRNGGKFNRIGVQRFIEGDRPGRVLTVDSRGNPALINGNGVTDAMPVWRVVFRDMWPDYPVQIRTGNLARYIEKIQEK